MTRSNLAFRSYGPGARRLLAALAAAFLLAACGSSDDAAPPAPPAPPAAVAPTITTPPAAVAVNEGAPAAFSVVAGGTAPLSYQWLRGGATISGATSASYTLAAATAGDDGAAFSVRVSNSVGSVASAAALLAVNRRPTLVTQPASVTVAELNTVTLTATVDGTAPFTYQWQRSADGTTWADIAAATAASYTTPQLVRTDDGTRFRVVVNNVTNQAVTSAAAQVTVTPDGAVALAAGGTVSGDNDKIRLQIAAGVLAGPTRFTFTPRTSFDGLPTGYTLAPGTAYDVTWSGAGFAAGRQVNFGIRTVAPAVVAADRVRVANTPNPPMTAVSNCPAGQAVVSPSTDQGGGYQGATAILCDGNGSVPTRVGLANPPPPPTTGPWTQVGVPALQRALDSVAFAGPSVAVALGTEARYIRSTNGGLTWTQSTGPLASNESGSIAFADANVGVIVSSRSSGGTIYRTTNAGANWTFAFNSGRMSAAAFGSPTVGVAVGDSANGIPARILRTTDAGLTWTESTVSAGLTSFTDVAFADVNTVVAVGGVTRRSTDGGQSFSPVTTPPGDAYKVAFGSPQVGVVVGFSGQAFWTVDGGQNWTAGTGAALATVARFHDVTFLDSNTAIAVGQGGGRGVILRSGDGGRTWTAVDAGITGVLVNYGVAFGSPTTGVVTGDTGSVLRTTTGGL
ncbi:MAG: hypothetical protein U5L03_09380 [Burkholderiaceae bacterium]|nr:hypothetical protein [Burkholderiaceae bacterium]